MPRCNQVSCNVIEDPSGPLGHYGKIGMGGKSKAAGISASQTAIRRLGKTDAHWKTRVDKVVSRSHGPCPVPVCARSLETSQSPYRDYCAPLICVLNFSGGSAVWRLRKQTNKPNKQKSVGDRGKVFMNVCFVIFLFCLPS